LPAVSLGQRSAPELERKRALSKNSSWLNSFGGSGALRAGLIFA